MNTLTSIYLIALIYPPPIPDGPAGVIGFNCSRLSLSTSRITGSKSFERSPDFVDSLGQIRSSLDGKVAVVFRVEGERSYLDSLDKGRHHWHSHPVAVKSLDSLSFHGDYAFAQSIGKNPKPVAYSFKDRKMIEVPPGRLISTSSGTYVWNKPAGSVWMMKRTTNPRWVRYKKESFLAKLRADFQFPTLSFNFLSSHPELIGGNGQCLYSTGRGSERTLIFRTAGGSYRVGELTEALMPHASMFPAAGHVLVSRYGDKIQEIRRTRGRFSEKVHWVNQWGQVGAQWVMVR